MHDFRWALPVVVLVVAGCEAPGRVVVRNPFLPRPIDIEVGGRAAVTAREAATEVGWRKGETIRVFYDLGCGRESAVLRLSEQGGLRVGDVDGIQWIQVSIDNRRGTKTEVQIGNRSVSAGAKSSAIVPVPATTCAAGVQVTVGGVAIGELPLVDPGKAAAAEKGPVAYALIDPSGAHCYRLRGGASPEGEALRGRALHFVERIDDLFPVAPDPARFQLFDEACPAAESSAAPKAVKRKSSSASVRRTKDPVGDLVESLSPRVNACVLTASKGDPLSVKIGAKVIVNLRGQLLDTQVTVMPPSGSAEEIRNCVQRILKGTKYPRTDVPLTTVVKNWNVQIAR